MLLSFLTLVCEQCLGSVLKFPRVNMLWFTLVVLLLEVFILRGFCIGIFQFFIDFMALDNSGCPEESRIIKDDVMDDEHSDCEDGIADCNDDDSDYDDDNADTEEDDSPEDAIKANETILRLQEENATKARIVEQLKKTVDELIEGGLQTEQKVRDLERLNEEKEIKICSVTAEMKSLKKEMALKVKDAEDLKRENEDKDSTLIILNSTVTVLEMEKETLYRDLKEMETDNTATHSQLKNLTEELERLRKETRRKQYRIESLQKESDDRNVKISSLEDELEVLTNEKLRAEENLQQLEECKIEMAEQKKEVQKLKDQNLQRDGEILRLENECSLKQKEVISLLKETKNFVAEKMNGQKNEMMRRTVQLEFELADLKEDLETMEFEKMEAIVEIESLQEENSAKDTKIRSLEREVEILKEMANERMKEKEVSVKMVQTEHSVSPRKVGKKSSSGKTRCLRKPQINCQSLYQQMDKIEKELHQIRALKQPSADTKRSSKALAKTSSVKKPQNTEVHHKMMMESAARLQRLEQESAMVRKLYKINSVT
ncbi:calponin homology domain-containing protein DDB_G0272472-like [Macrobrachium rosenbergii]|uniref:calponin homology domain-containing protein DDB_G0272472-like n=1 Tax=Macrobrachium rosenbergii TaxID=79674 RepID=UPI0034D5999D